MTPEERDLVTELFDRLATLEDAQRDPEAERIIEDGLRQAPNAAYALVQTVLVQDEALKRADARIRELEATAETARPEASFLGSMRDSLFGRRAPRGSVPLVRSGEAAPEMSRAWRATPAVSTEPAPAPVGQGGSFLGTAAAAAAGMVGGSLLLAGIRSMMGGHGSFGAIDSAAAPSGGGSSLWSGGASAADNDFIQQADDIGRASSASDDLSAGGRGLFDSNANDADENQDSADFGDASDFDIEDGGGGEE
jgi:hypothetical protein